MADIDAPKEVQITHHNEGFSVVYSSGQRALRSTFDSQQAAIDAVNDWNRVGDFQMRLAAEVLDHRYDVDEERAKMGLKPLAEERDGQYFVDEIMTLKALGSPDGKVLNDISRLDLDGSDAKAIFRLADQGLSLIKQDDVFFDALKTVCDFGKDQADLDARAARKMLSICQDAIDAQSAAAPSMR